MARSTPVVRDETLRDGATTLPLGTAAWPEWLACHALFRFEDSTDSFTARRERRSGGDYWYAYRRRAGRLRNAYLGRDADLTPERLRDVARQLAEFGDERAAQTDATFIGKVVAPTLAPGSVARERLLAQLDAIPTFPLTVVTAPAGYGKTTLLAQWVARRHAAQPHLPLAWLSLDESDNDPARFARHLAVALAQSGTTLRNVRRGIADLPQALVAATAQQSLILVLDDYHAITSESIHAALAEIIAAAPTGLHLVLASRNAPPFPLARLRARGELLEIGAGDLRFTTGETGALLAQRHGLTLEPAALAALDARAEGWVAALQLVARSLQGRDADEQGAVITAFDGEQRVLEDYLVAEVLDRLPEIPRRFLLATAVAGRLCADLAGALTGLGSEAASAILRDLERSVLLVQPLDERRQWYRYHPLLADCLRARLRQEHPGELSRLHRAAARWCAAHDLLPEAARHAAAAGDHDYLIELIVRNVERLMGQGEIATIRAWLDHLPPRTVREQPELLLWSAWTRIMGGDLDAVESLLQTMEARIDELEERIRADLPVPAYARQFRRHALLGQADTMRAMIARRRGDFGAAVTFAQRALRQIPADIVISGVVSLQLGQVQLRCGDIAAAETALTAALANAERTGHTLLRVGALTALARVRLAQGARSEARALLRRARQAAEATGSAYLGAMIGPDLADTGDHDDELALLEPLSPRERDVLRLLSQGLTNRAIAGRLHVAPDTIRWHAKNIYSKLGATNRTQATALAQRFGLLEPASAAH